MSDTPLSRCAYRRASSATTTSASPGLGGPPIADGGPSSHHASSGLEAVIDKLEGSTEDIFPKLDKIVTDISAITGSW